MNLIVVIVLGLVAISTLFAVSVLYIVPIIITSIDIDAVYFLAAIVTIFSLILSPLVYFIKRWNNEKAETKRASGNICRELRDTLESLDRSKFRNESIDFTTKDGKKVYFMNRVLNHDFYDSLISSGKINFLDPDLQQHVQNIFKLIKRHNEHLKIAEKIRIDKQESFPEETHIYHIWMERDERMLLQDIPVLIKNIEFKFGNCTYLSLNNYG